MSSQRPKLLLCIFVVILVCFVWYLSVSSGTISVFKLVQPKQRKQNVSILSNNDHELSNNVSILSLNESTLTEISNNESTLNESIYLSKLLFGDTNSTLYNHFMNERQNVTSFIPLHMNYFRESRSVYGDVSHIRFFLDKLINKKQCITGIGIGGSITAGNGVLAKYRPRGIWTGELEYYLNQKFPCHNKHRIINRGSGGHGTIKHFWRLPSYITNNDAWLKYDCSDIDIIIFESSTNDNGGSHHRQTSIYTELFIRQILLCNTEIALIYLHVARGHFSSFSGNWNKAERYWQGDYQHMNVLNYYQIPTIGLTDIIYPLSFRYHLLVNGTGVSRLTDFLHLNYKFKYLKNVQEYMTAYENDNVRNNIVENDHDIRFNDDQHGKHLRCDFIHSCQNAHKFYVALLAYLFLTEYDMMMKDVEQFSNIKSMRNVIFDNRVYDNMMLPPFLSSEIQDDPLLYYMATSHALRSSLLNFDEKKTMPDKGKTYSAKGHVGPWKQSIIHGPGLQIEVEDYFSIYFANPGWRRFAHFIGSGYNDKRYNFTDMELNILPTNNAWQMIAEGRYRLKKLGIIGYNVSDSISFKLLWIDQISDAIKSSQLQQLKQKYFSTIFCIVSYLTSYENMGVAQIWITDKTRKQNVSNIQLIDALALEKQSVAAQHVFEINLKQNESEIDQYEYYFHAKIIEAIPTRDKNKFKILQVNLMGIRDVDSM